MAHVFLSYATGDKQWVDYLYRSLVSEKGFTVWMDQDMFASIAWPGAIRTAIRDCAAVIAVLSPRVTSSSYVVNEITDAQKLSKPVIPVLIEACTLPTSLGHLSNLHWVDFTRNSFPQALESLTRTLIWLGITPTAPPPPPVPAAPPLQEVIIGSWHVDMSWQNVGLQLTLNIAPPPLWQFGGTITIPAPMMPEIKPYSGVWRIDGKEVVLDGYWQSLYESKQWRQAFYIERTSQDVLQGFTPPEKNPCRWTRIRL
jgi:hypothetical protein